MNARLTVPAPAEPTITPGVSLLHGHDQQSQAAVKEKTLMKTAAMIEAAEYARNRPRDIAALHHMQANRPLRPVPYDFGPVRNRAALVEARADRKRGLV